jgi:hypothetical protein
MANVKISALPAATLPLAGTEELPLVQSTATKKVTVDSINANATLQQVTAGFNKDLTNDRNLQGTDAGNNNTGDRVNAFGNGALKDNTGDDVNAFGSSTGEGNAFNSVNFFGHGTSADADQQAVFGNYNGTTTFNARLSYKDISDDRKYELPDASGTLVLSVNGNTADAQGDVVITPSGGVQTVKVSLASADILSLNGSGNPFLLIAAPGASKFLNVLSITSIFNFVTTAYSVNNTLNYCLGLPDSGGALLAQATSFLSNTFNVLNINSISRSTLNITGIGGIQNQGLYVYCNATAPTLGDGTVDIYVSYIETNI